MLQSLLFLRDGDSLLKASLRDLVCGDHIAENRERQDNLKGPGDMMSIKRVFHDLINPYGFS